MLYKYFVTLAITDLEFSLKKLLYINVVIIYFYWFNVCIKADFHSVQNVAFSIFSIAFFCLETRQLKAITKHRSRNCYTGWEAAFMLVPIWTHLTWPNCISVFRFLYANHLFGHRLKLN
jgi:hypothetical protein